MDNTKATLQASWASHSLAQRALAYHRVRFFGSLGILFMIVYFQVRSSNASAIEGIIITGIDLVILIWQRHKALQGEPKFSTWVSLVAAAIIGTLGLRLGGGFMTLSYSLYLILILGAAFVFWARSAAYWMAGITCTLFLTLVVSQLSNFVVMKNPLMAVAYNLDINARLLFANISFGVLMILIVMVTAGSAAETLGNWNMELSNEVEHKTNELTEMLKEKERIYRTIVTTLANIIEARDKYTNDHSQRIARLAMNTAKILEYNDYDLERVRLAAILHDIGKVAVPDNILNKPGLLTKKEQRVIMHHPDIGADILSTIEDLQDVAEVIRTHQEKYDGTGYPKGLRGDEIPLTARIIAAVDAYIAMTDQRPYKEAQSKNFAVQELINESGKHFDPEVIDAFLYVLQTEK